MPRTLGQLPEAEKEALISAIQQQAQDAGWHRLSNQAKALLYDRWEAEFDLSHATVKDSIMKGFDAAQHIPRSGKAQVHHQLTKALEQVVPYVGSKVRRAGWRSEVDLVLGYSPNFLTHVVELEPAPSWQTGLQQCLLYKSLYFQRDGIQALPTLILFGDVTSERWSQIFTVCTDNRVLLASYELLVDGEPADRGIMKLLG